MRKWLQDFLENEPLYKAVKITADQLQKMFNIKDITISQYCETYKQQRSFKCHSTGFEDMEKEYMHFSVDSGFDYDIKDYGEQCWNIFLLELSCQHECGEMHYITILIKGLTIQKIGQYPTFAKEEVSKNLIKYKSLIPKYYPELTKAVSAYSQNMGVPAFVYLRRILEHLVETKYKTYGGATEIKFIDKLKEVEKHEKLYQMNLMKLKINYTLF